MPKKKQKWYAVRKGRQTGVFNTWDECQKHVRGFSGALFKSFTSRQAADDFVTQSAEYGAKPSSAAAASGAAGTAQAAASVGGGKRAREAGSHPSASPSSPKRLARIFDPPCVWQAYFDGGSRGNPGIAGAGACVIVQDEEVASAVQGCKHGSTNNEAECIGAALALRLLSALLEAVQSGRVSLPPPSSINVLGDSKLIINQVQGIWAVKSPNLKGPLAELRQLASDLHTAVRSGASHTGTPGGAGLQWQHVKRELNKRADHLSNLAMDSAKVAYEPPFAPVSMFDAGRRRHLRAIVGHKNASVVWTSNAAVAQKFLVDDVAYVGQGVAACAAGGVASAGVAAAHVDNEQFDSDGSGEYEARRPKAGEVMTQAMAQDILYDIYPDEAGYFLGDW